MILLRKSEQQLVAVVLLSQKFSSKPDADTCPNHRYKNIGDKTISIKSEKAENCPSYHTAYNSQYHIADKAALTFHNTAGNPASQCSYQ